VALTSCFQRPVSLNPPACFEEVNSTLTFYYQYFPVDSDAESGLEPLAASKSEEISHPALLRCLSISSTIIVPAASLRASDQ
jgi:hypothetical protein